VTNPKSFRAPWITPEEIASVIKAIQKEFPICAQIPVNVLGFAEHDLKLEFHFKPISHLGQDAFLLRDFSGIVFDEGSFCDPASSKRLNFSVAHELGHFYMHRDVYGNCKFSSIDQWLDFVEKVSPPEYQKIEWQADEFAGQLLMPAPILAKALDETISDAEKEGYFPLGQDAVFEFCCRAMNRDFGVSQQAMQTRLRRSKLWPHPRAPKNPN
jgi:hypothetical protein